MPCANRAQAGRKKLNYQRLKVVRPIGMGGQGGVWLAYDVSSGRSCALKQIRKGRLAQRKMPASLSTAQWLVEKQAVEQLGTTHPFITSCFATFQDAQSLFFALELAPCGDLYGLVNKHVRPPCRGLH